MSKYVLGEGYRASASVVSQWDLKIQLDIFDKPLSSLYKQKEILKQCTEDKLSK